MLKRVVDILSGRSDGDEPPPSEALPPVPPPKRIAQAPARVSAPPTSEPPLRISQQFARVACERCSEPILVRLRAGHVDVTCPACEERAWIDTDELARELSRRRT